ncbi:MAG: polymerase protein [candidate division WWE3 bacterium GW2011_GWA1_42_46]|nr:MAG: polymerase protein [candidate division WWE3 bacterium GW2011_GWA1_42_46]
MELKFDPANPSYEYITKEDQANAALENLEKAKVVGVDIESTGLDPYTSTLLLVQIGTDDKSYIFDARALDLKNFTRFKEFLESPKILKIFHNGKFDYNTNLYDTMLAEVILNAGLGRGYYSLKDLTKKYTGMDLKKDVRETFEGVTNKTKINVEQLKYSALDTLILFPIFDQQLVKIKSENLLNVAKLEFAATRAVGEMEVAGYYGSPF